MIEETTNPHHRREAGIGLAYGVSAYMWWGFIPLYFKLVAHIPSPLVLAHRVVWSFTFLGLLVALLGRWDDFRLLLRRRNTLLTLAATTVLLAINWGTFIFAVATNRVIQASLGYFIVPLASAALGFIVLKERLRRWQMIALTIAGAGVIALTMVRGQLPWIALSIAFSWCGYALLRKIAHVGPLIGTAVETAMLLPIALAYIGWNLADASQQALTHYDFALLMLGGIVTAVPLLCFTAAAKRLRMATIGFLQYLAPTGHFLLGVFAFHEHVSSGSIAGFALIWTALLIYSIDSLRAYRSANARDQVVTDPMIVDEM